MPLTTLYYQFAIRNAGDTADEFTFTSIAGGTNPYIQQEPSGDGQSFDPLDGSVQSGSYKITLADPEVGGVRVVTSILPDAAGRQRLMGRKAFIREGTDGTTYPTTLAAGYLTGLTKADAVTYSATVGDSRRIEQDREVFGAVTASFDRVSCLIGGPIRGGFGPIKDYGGWRFKVTIAQAGEYVALSFVRGYVRGQVVSSATGGGGYTPFSMFAASGNQYTLVNGAVPNKALDVINTAAAPYSVRDHTLANRDLVGLFPRLQARVQNKDTGALVGTFVPFVKAEAVTTGGSGVGAASYRTYGLLSPLSVLYLQWTASQPAVNTEYDIFVYPLDVTELNPLHIYDHPVGVMEALWNEALIPYDTTAALAARNAIGPLTRVEMRPTKPMKQIQVERQLNALFGLATRIGTDGKRVLFTTRIVSASTPAQTVTVADVYQEDSAGPSGAVFEVSEQTIRNRVTVRLKQFMLWSGATGGQQPFDGIEAQPDDVTVDYVDSTSVNHATTYGAREEVYELEGNIQTAATWTVAGIQYITGSTAVLTRTVAVGIAQEVFDRHAGGVPEGEIGPCVRAITANVGDEIALALPHQNNAAVIGGTRYVQIVQRTESPIGPTFRVRDSGVNQQPATVPTFTLAAETSNPQQQARVTVTNASTLGAAGLSVRIEWASGASSPVTAGSLLTVVSAQLLAIGATMGVTTPTTDAGTKVWVRMRSEAPLKRAGTWTAWSSIQLTALVAPSALTGTALTDPSTYELRWTVGVADVPVIIKYKLSTETLFSSVRMAPGSTRYTLTGLTPSSAYNVEVLHQEDAPHKGLSAAATLTFTPSGTTAVLAVPTAPAAFAGTLDLSGNYVADGTFGIEVTASVFPAFVGVELAVETAVASGTPGTYKVVGIVPAVQLGRTRWTGYAPNDRLYRYLRAYSFRAGDTSSGYTAAVSVDPWVATPPVVRPTLVVTATAVSAATPRIDVAVTSSSRSLIRLYRKAGSAAAVTDTLVATSAADATSLAHQSTGLVAATVYHYLATATDLLTGVTAEINAAARASATFPSAGTSGHIDTVVLSGAAIDSPTAPPYSRTLTVTITYGDALVTDTVYITGSADGSAYTQLDSFTPVTGASNTIARNITMFHSSFGTLYIRVRIESNVPALLSSLITTASTAFRGEL